MTKNGLSAYHQPSGFRNGDKHGQRSVTQQQGSQKAQAGQEACASGRRLSDTHQERQGDQRQVLIHLSVMPTGMGDSVKHCSWSCLTTNATTPSTAQAVVMPSIRMYCTATDAALPDGFVSGHLPRMKCDCDGMLSPMNGRPRSRFIEDIHGPAVCILSFAVNIRCASVASLSEVLSCAS